MTGKISRKRMLAVALAATLLSACVPANYSSTRFYVLTPLNPSAALMKEGDRKDALSVEILSIRLPQYLERPQIVTRSATNRLELAENQQWGGNLGKDMVRTLAQNLSRILGTPRVAMAPHRPPAPPSVCVEVEVMQFERDPKGQVRLTAQWRLSRGGDRELLAAQITELTGRETHAESDFESTVTSMSALWGELSKIIGGAILEHMKKTPDS